MRQAPSVLATVFARHARAFLAAAFALALLAAFVELSVEVFEGELAGIDRRILVAFRGLRSPALTRVALDVSTLGSAPVLAVFTSLLALGLVRAGHRRTALLLVVVATGAGAWTSFLKHVFERRRPDEAFALAAATGLSYPSGHSLSSAAIFGTAAVLLGAYRRSPVDRALATVCTVALLGAIGASRVYLGVHYPSDVLAGFSAGLAWAFAVLAVGAWLASRRGSG